MEAQKGPGTSAYCIINSYKTNHLCGYWPPGAFISLQEAWIKNRLWYSKTKDDKPLQKANATERYHGSKQQEGAGCCKSMGEGAQRRLSSG